MNLPPLYKYLNVHGAKLTLSNGTFKHAKPTDFNDLEELTVKSIFPKKIEETLKEFADVFNDVILEHLEVPPTCAPPMRQKIQAIQTVFQKDPKLAQSIKTQLQEENCRKPIYDVEHMHRITNQFIAEINEFMQGYRILCVTTLKDSERMWSMYADNHSGVALRIEPNIGKDSKFQLFEPVNYYQERPPLYESVRNFCADSLFGNKDACLKKMMDKVVYSKTLEWKDECEYRLAIPIHADEAQWDTLKFHPEEITELYLGSAMCQSDKDKIASMAKAVNPNIAIYQTSRDPDGKLIHHLR